jgi:hypothetical protein
MVDYVGGGRPVGAGVTDRVGQVLEVHEGGSVAGVVGVGLQRLAVGAAWMGRVGGAEVGDVEGREQVLPPAHEAPGRLEDAYAIRKRRSFPSAQAPIPALSVPNTRALGRVMAISATSPTFTISHLSCLGPSLLPHQAPHGLGDRFRSRFEAVDEIQGAVWGYQIGDQRPSHEPAQALMGFVTYSGTPGGRPEPRRKGRRQRPQGPASQTVVRANTDQLGMGSKEEEGQDQPSHKT